jgi:hypothetical protein
MSKQREVVLRLGRQEFKLVTPQEAMLFRDVHDHLTRINDLLENFREMLTSIQEAYLSVTSNRLNEIMKFLTLFTAVLMPLTVITGIYGMNFEHMPELRERLGYPAVLAIMGVVSGSVLVYFWRRGWLGRPPPLEPMGVAVEPDARPGSDGQLPIGVGVGVGALTAPGTVEEAPLDRDRGARPLPRSRYRH